MAGMLRGGRWARLRDGAAVPVSGGDVGSAPEEGEGGLGVAVLGAEEERGGLRDGEESGQRDRRARSRLVGEIQRFAFTWAPWAGLAAWAAARTPMASRTSGLAPNSRSTAAAWERPKSAAIWSAVCEAMRRVGMSAWVPHGGCDEIGKRRLSCLRDLERARLPVRVSDRNDRALTLAEHPADVMVAILRGHHERCLAQRRAACLPWGGGKT